MTAQIDYSVFNTDLATIPALSADEKAVMLETLKVTYEHAKGMTFDGLLPASILLEYGAEMKAIWAALGFVPR